jgi:hypothetical protein
MKIVFFTTSALCLSLLASQAYTAELSKGEQAAGFRLKVASCKAQAKTDSVKQTSSAFYTYMAGCIDRVTVNVAWLPVSEEKH